jgi:hypothetical protein
MVKIKTSISDTMSIYEKINLIYSDYSWTTYNHDDPKVSGEPDRTLLNRNEGYEVLYFINKFMETHELKKISSGNKIEKLIRENVPENFHCQDKIHNWIVKNWKSY